MAYVFIDGFDKYGATPGVTSGFSLVNNLFNLLAGQWTATTMSASQFGIAAPLSGYGYSLSLGSASGAATYLAKTIPSVSRVIGGMRISTDWQRNGINYFNGGTSGTAAFTIWVNLTGQVELTTGNGGTVLATGVAAVGKYAPHYVEWDITIGASSAYEVWVDGISIFSGTGNTGNGQTAVDTFALRSNIQASVFYVDDLYLFDSTGGTNNAPLLSNPVVDTEYATADSQTQWTFGQGILGQMFSTFSNSNATADNVLVVRKFTPTVNCTMSSIGVMMAASRPATNMKGVVYSDSGGSPNSLLSDGVQTSNTGNIVTLSLVTPQSLTAGTPVWIGFYADHGDAIALVDSGGSSGQKKAVTYTSGAPATLSGMTTGQPDWWIWGYLTGITSNDWSALVLNPPPVPTGTDLSYIQSSTVGNEDLYTIHALQQVPSSIAVTAVKAYCRLSDAGARTVDLRLKSGGTDSAGSNAGQTPAQTYQWIETAYETDPNTASAWTATNLNNATSGIKVAS